MSTLHAWVRPDGTVARIAPSPTDRLAEFRNVAITGCVDGMPPPNIAFVDAGVDVMAAPYALNDLRSHRQDARRVETAARLSVTDGYVIRATDPTGGVAIPDWALVERQAIRDASAQRAAWIADPKRDVVDLVTMEDCPIWP